MRHKLVITKKFLYEPLSNNWAFVKKVKKGFKVLGEPSSCKDFMHDVICNNIYKRNIHLGTGYPIKAGVCFKHLQIVMFFYKDLNKKRHIYSCKRMLNVIEKANNVKCSTIIEVENKYEHFHTFVIKADKIYIESPALMHGLVAFLRTMHYYKKNITYKNIVKTLHSSRYKDSDVLKFVIKKNIMNLLMANHKEIYNNLTLKDIYPEKVTNITHSGRNINSYHGGFGMVALQNKTLACKKYNDRVMTVLNRHGTYI